MHDASRARMSLGTGSIAAVIGMGVLATSAMAQQPQRLSVNRDDPAIAAFTPPKLAPAGPAIPSLDIPVMGFPAGQPRSPNLAPAGPAPQPQIITGGNDRSWYTLRYELPGLFKVVVTGDLNVQPTDVPVPASEALEITTATQSKDDDEAPIARIVTRRFPNIPYVADITCRPAALSLCSSEGELRELASQLGLLSVPPK